MTGPRKPRRDTSDLIKKNDVAKILKRHPDTIVDWSDKGYLPEPIRQGPQKARHWPRKEIEKIKAAMDRGEWEPKAS